VDLTSYALDKTYGVRSGGKFRSFTTSPGVAMSNIATGMLPFFITPFLLLAYMLVSPHSRAGFLALFFSGEKN
jgi:hypothetical protein